jgi:hypothetical protein
VQAHADMTAGYAPGHAADAFGEDRRARCWPLRELRIPNDRAVHERALPWADRESDTRGRPLGLERGVTIETVLAR